MQRTQLTSTAGRKEKLEPLNELNFLCSTGAVLEAEEAAESCATELTRCIFLIVF